MIDIILLMFLLSPQEPAQKLAETTHLWYRSSIVELGGVDQDGKYYIVVEGTRNPCSRRDLIKAVKESKLLNTQSRGEALRALGVPVGIEIWGEKK